MDFILGVAQSSDHMTTRASTSRWSGGLVRAAEFAVQIKIERGHAYLALGEPEKAVLYHQALAAYAREAGILHSLGYNLYTLGLAFADMGRAVEALDHFQQALDVGLQIDERRLQAFGPDTLAEARNRGFGSH